jgi:hypothetical protein
MINHWASIIVVFQKFWGAGHRFEGPVPPWPQRKTATVTYVNDVARLDSLCIKI